ncbi:MAG: hypothetical protein UY89_C0015G0003 [Parcubacteria group bacterium GW2011_GWA1_54_9]|nr:MAG: hypothetical protein UY89_C0015G0003 [Parcubacteria group bacterium GW2011_GWA1_54_9]
MPEKHNEESIFFLYELAHIDACIRFLDEHPQVREGGYLIVPSGLKIEYALAEKGLPFRSLREYRPRDTSRFRLAEEWTVKTFDSPQWKWFQYRGVSLTQMFFLNIQDYFLRLLYYGTILENLLVRHPAARRLVVFPSSHSLQAVPVQKISSVRQQPLLRELLVAVVSCARLIGAQRGIEVVIPVVIPHATVSVKRLRLGRLVFALKRALLELGMDIYNASITLLRPRGTPRILASDYWRNIEPILSQLPRGELMLFDRTETFKAGVKNLWRYRVRLYNFSSFSVRNRKRVRAEAERMFKERWHELRAHGLPEYSYSGFALRPLMVEALDGLCANVIPQTLRDIDGAYAMLTRLAPDVVFLRASVSLQTHFDILAQVARARGIPSLELQHGLENLGPGSYSKRHSAEYIAVYGPVIQEEFVAVGYPRERIPIVGSPRFDSYQRAADPSATDRSEGRKGMAVLCIGTLVGVESAQDEYDLEDYYLALARALEKVPGSSVVIKLRPGSAHERFYLSTIERIFARVPHTIAQYESFPELFDSTDVVASYYSTTVLEALKFGKPTIVYSGEPREEAMIRYHFTRYAEAGGLLTAYTQEELEEAFRSLAGDTALRTRLAERANKAIKQFHLFDGGASGRIVELIERLARRQNRCPSP